MFSLFICSETLSHNCYLKPQWWSLHGVTLSVFIQVTVHELRVKQFISGCGKSTWENRLTRSPFSYCSGAFDQSLAARGDSPVDKSHQDTRLESGTVESTESSQTHQAEFSQVTLTQVKSRCNESGGVKSMSNQGELSLIRLNRVLLRGQTMQKLSVQVETTPVCVNVQWVTLLTKYKNKDELLRQRLCRFRQRIRGGASSFLYSDQKHTLHHVTEDHS